MKKFLRMDQADIGGDGDEDDDDGADVSIEENKEYIEIMKQSLAHEYEAFKTAEEKAGKSWDSKAYCRLVAATLAARLQTACGLETQMTMSRDDSYTYAY